MYKKSIMKKFIKIVENQKLLTTLIKNIFDYENFNDYNYIFRMIESEDSIIIDIYDNISINRFNRYIFIFSHGNYPINTTEKNNVFITTIYLENVKNSSNKLLKLAYLFTLKENKMIEFAKTFLDENIVNILNNIITNNITY